MLRFLFVLATLFGVNNGAKFPENQTKCRWGDSQCFAKVATEIASGGRRAYPELGIPVLDPLSVKKIGIDQGGNGPVNLRLDITDAQMEGFSELKFKSIQGLGKNIDKAKIEIKYSHPKYTLSGNYKANGKVLILPVQGEGKANFTLYDVEGFIKILTKQIEKNGKRYMQIDKIRFNFENKNARIELTNLFNGNKQLGDTFNKFANDNWMDIIREIKPAMANSIAQIYKSILNNLFSNIPYDEMFIE